MKICTKCHIEKDESEFKHQKDCKDGLRPDCKDCNKEYYKKYKEKNNDAVLAVKRKYYYANKDEIRRKQIEYCKKNPEVVSMQNRRSWHKNKEKYLPKTREYRQNNKEKLNENSRLYYHNVSKEKDRIRKSSSEYKEKANKTRKERWNNDESYRIRNLKKLLDRQRENVDRLLIPYIRRRLIEDGYSREDIKNYPFLIEKKKLEILIKRNNKIQKQIKTQTL